MKSRQLTPFISVNHHYSNKMNGNIIKDIYEESKELNIDCIVTCAYGQFLPTKIIELAKIKAINVYALCIRHCQILLNREGGKCLILQNNILMKKRHS